MIHQALMIHVNISSDDALDQIPVFSLFYPRILPKANVDKLCLCLRYIYYNPMIVFFITLKSI